MRKDCRARQSQCGGAIKGERHLLDLAADQRGDGFARICATHPAQRAMTCIDPPEAPFWISSVKNIAVN